MSIKNELNKIEIPENLSERSRQGIIKAEKSKKRSPILPLVSTIIVTAAALLFVFNYEKLMPTNSTSAAQPTSVELLNPYTIAIVCTLIVFAITSFLSIKKKLRIHWIFTATIAALCISWNLAEHEMNSLIKPYILPVFSAEATDRMTIYYLVNKDDSIHIDTVYINNEPYDAIDPRELSLQDLPAKEEFKNRQLKAVFLQSNGQDFSKLLADGNTALVAEFSNKTKQSINFEPFLKLKEREQFVKQINVSYGKTSADIYQYSTRLQLSQPLEAKSINFPENMLNHFSMKLSVTPYDEQIKDWNFAETEYFFNFAISHPNAPLEYSFKKGDLIEIIIENRDFSKHLPLLEDIITIQTTNGSIPIVVNDHLYLSHYEEMLPTLIERQRGELNE